MYKNIFLDDIVEIIECEEEDTIDIEVTGNNLFIANGLVTHNSGFMDSDPGLENTSESFGLPATADMMFVIITSEELENLGQVMIKQLKNRWCDINSPKRFVVGIDRSKMKLYDVDDSMSGVLNEDVPVMDNSKFGERFDEDTKPSFKKFRKRGNNDFH